MEFVPTNKGLGCKVKMMFEVRKMHENSVKSVVS
jgi:hypothetical protein